MKWYEDFDINKFMKDNNLTNLDLSKILNKCYSGTCQFTSRKYVTNNMAKLLYEYVISVQNKQEPKQEEIISDDVTSQNDEKNVLPQLIEARNDDETPLKEYPTTEILRRLLITRLTEEEKELIRIFGGRL